MQSQFFAVISATGLYLNSNNKYKSDDLATARLFERGEAIDRTALWTVGAKHAQLVTLDKGNRIPGESEDFDYFMKLEAVPGTQQDVCPA